MEFREVYCLNCKKVLGRYNSKFYSEEKIETLLKRPDLLKYLSFRNEEYPCLQN